MRVRALLLQPCVAVVILCSPGGFTLLQRKGDKSSSYLHSSSQISRWLSTRICEMCLSTSYCWWQGWLGAVSQSEKSKDKVKQGGDRNSQGPRLCHGTCWQGCFLPRRKDLTTTGLQMGQRGSGCSLSNHHHISCAPLLRRLSLDWWQCGAMSEQMSRGWSKETVTGRDLALLAQTYWSSHFPWRKKRKSRQ